MAQLTPFADENVQSGIQQNLQRFIVEQRSHVAKFKPLDDPFAGWSDFVHTFLQHIGLQTLSALSHDYESKARLDQVIKDTNTRINELLKLEPNLLKTLERFYEDKAVRLLTIHKSKGLEFDTVIILGVESQSFWGKPDDERCSFFVGISRAKKRLILTVSDRREIPPSNPRNWNETRTSHPEFLGYAMPFLNPDQ